jgi:glycosyltransferase involved in cell wall biosynthesis
MKYKILIFIITYKASYRVKDLLKKIPFGYLKKLKFEIYISDDHSNDDTVDFIKDLKRKYKNKLNFTINKRNVGYGGNIKRCINYAYKRGFDYAIMVHGDNQYNPKYIKDMLTISFKNPNVAAVVGSRMAKKLNALKGNMPLYKFIGNIVLTKFFNIFYSSNFTDCHTGYWAYNLNKIKKQFFVKADNGFCFDIDMRLMLTKDKATIRELPIDTYYGTERSSMHITYAVRFFLRVLKYKLFNSL